MPIETLGDFEVHDACRKIFILASIAFGRHIMPHQVSTDR
jgi:homoserine dehydrogenase